MSNSPKSLNKFAFQMYQNGIPSEKWQEAYDEKQQIKRLSNIFGASLSVQFVSSIIVSFALSLLVLVLKYFAHIYFPAIYNGNKPLLENAFTLYMYITYMFIAFAVMAYMLKKNPLKEINARRIKKPALILPAVIISLLFYAVGTIVSILIEQYMAVIHLKTVVSGFKMPTQTSAIVFYVLTICVFAPLLEEFIFRGLILQSLRKFGDVFAIVISALLFGLMHGNLMQAPFAFVTALAFGYFVIKFNSIWVSVIAHCVINSSSVALDFFQNKLGAANTSIIILMILGGILIFSALSALILIRTDFFKENKLKNPSIFTPNLKFKSLIFTPWFIVFVGIVLLEITLTTKII